MVTFSLAVDRKKKEDGTHDTDWITCVAWEKTAELIGKFAKKGKKLAVIGHLQNRKYTTQNGEERYSTEVLVKEIEFLGEKIPEKEEPKTEPNWDEDCPF